MKAYPEAQIRDLKFGTDGWRAVIAEEFTFANVERLSQAYADFIKQHSGSKPSAAVAFDNRFLAREFAHTVADVLLGNGIDTSVFTHSVPTPLLSFLTHEYGYSGAVMITASHNPAQYCGFKIKESWGGSAFEATTSAVESLLDKNPVRRNGATDFKTPPADLEERYNAHLHKLVDCGLIGALKEKLIVDSMHGTGAYRIEQLISGKQLSARTIRGEADCLFGGIAPEPIDKNLAMLKDAVTKDGAIAGVATDGDADRLGVVDENGQTMTMHAVAPILLLHLIKKKLSGAVVATVTQSVLIKRIAEAFGLPYIETPVGFKYIAREMLDGDVLIGAEESGGISTKGHIPERDGILNALLFVEALAAAGLKPSRLIEQIQEQYGTFHYDRIDMRVDIGAGKKIIEALRQSPPDKLLGEPVVSINAEDGIKLFLSDDSWLMFRQSGTEPLLRIYCESPTPEKTAKLLDLGTTMCPSPA